MTHQYMEIKIKELEERIKELEQESKTDTWSIKDVADTFKKHGLIREREPKTGHWILKRTFPTKLYDENLNEYKCSECYREIRCTESQLVNYPYCHCGAKMIYHQVTLDEYVLHKACQAVLNDAKKEDYI